MSEVQERIDRDLLAQGETPAWVSASVFTAAEVKPSDRRPARHEGAYSVLELLQWAFSVELAHIDLNEIPVRRSRGVEAVLLDQAALGGVKIDRSAGISRPADDAEIIANVVATDLRPDLAIRVAELARSCRVPDWMEGATPRCVPCEWKRNQYSEHAATISVGKARVRGKRGRTIEVDIRCCPVTYAPSATKIAAVRRQYLDWWGALLMVRSALKTAGLSHHAVNDIMPPKAPWKKTV